MSLHALRSNMGIDLFLKIKIKISDAAKRSISLPTYIMLTTRFLDVDD